MFLKTYRRCLLALAAGVAMAISSCVTEGPEQAQPGSVPLNIPIRGRVVSPDGLPVAGAHVSAHPVCAGIDTTFASDGMTGADGTFVLYSADRRCGKLQITAEKKADYWLEIGDGFFYSSPNGVPTQVELSGSVQPEPVTVRLGARGGLVDLLVRDEAAYKYIDADVVVHRVAAEGKSFGVEQLDTDSVALPLLLPAGQYTVTLYAYPCGKKRYIAKPDITESFTVVPGQFIEPVIRIDTRLVLASPSQENPEGKACKE